MPTVSATCLCHAPRLSARVICLFLPICLHGCALGPDYQRPPIETPAGFRFSESQASELADTRWWEQFRDPQLNGLIRTALAENKDIKLAAARVDQFLGQFTTTRAALFPQVGAQFNAQRQRNVVNDSAAGTGNIFFGGLTASWEIDLFGLLRRQSEAAQANLLASEEGRRATLLSLVAAVAQSYINLRSLDRQLAIANDTAASRKESLRVFQRRFEGGTVSELELSQSQAEYEDTVARIPVIEQQIAQQENGLSILLGRNPGPISRGQPLDRLGLPAVPGGLPSELLARRPDLRQAEQLLISANALIGAARARYFPVISLTGLFGSVSPELGDLFSGPDKAWNFAANVSMPVFTAGAVRGQVQQAEAVQQQALFNYERAIQLAFREVEDSLVAHQKTRQALEMQARELKTVGNYVRLARKRYDNGYTSYIEVLDAERNLFNVELAYAQTRSALYSSLVNLYKAMGGGWVASADDMTARPGAGQQAQP